VVERWLLALLCVLLSCSVAAADRTSVRITVLDSTPQTGALQLSWPQPVQTRIQSKRDEHLLTFSQPLGEPDFTAVTERLTAFIRDLRFGYDTVLLILAPGATAGIEPEPNGVIVRFTQPAPSSVPPAEAPSESPWRLDYLHAIALLESGDAQAAQRQLHRLARAYPQEPEILHALARATEQLGDWSGALSLYDSSAALSPESRAAAAARDRLWFAHADHVRGEFGRRSTDGADDQDILRISGRALLTPRIRVLAAAEHRTLQAAAVQRASGEIQSVEVNRSRGELGIEYHSGARSTRANLLLGPDRVGLGLRLAVNPPARYAWLEASLDEPYWEYVEGLVDGAHRDRLAAGVRGERSARWQGAATVHANRYAMEAVGEVADSFGVGASLGVVFHRNAATWLAVYRLDAEYFSDVAERTATDGRGFEPLPAASREVHALGIEVGRSETAPMHYNLAAGYSIDRKGPDAPYFALQLDYAPTPQLLIGLRASYSLAVDRREDNPVSYIGAAGEYRFARRNAALASRSAPAATPTNPLVIQPK